MRVFQDTLSQAHFSSLKKEKKSLLENFFIGVPKKQSPRKKLDRRVNILTNDKKMQEITKKHFIL